MKNAMEDDNFGGCAVDGLRNKQCRSSGSEIFTQGVSKFTFPVILIVSLIFWCGRGAFQIGDGLVISTTAAVDDPTRTSKEYLDRNKHLPIAAASQCTKCEFLSSHNDPQNPPDGSTPKLVRMTSTGGYGRTGNSVVSMFIAMKLAYICKSTLELPRTDSNGGVLHFQERLFDFTQRPGEASTHLPCDRKFVGNARPFFYAEKLFTNLSISDAPDVPINAEVNSKLWACMRQFLGICVKGMCAGHRAAQEGVLVVHLRQGDIYKPKYSGRVHIKYQQPFLAYYYSIINFTNPEKVIFVGEDVNHGPIWDAFEDLQSFEMTKYAIEFQSSNLTEDLLTMLCARNLAESKSTMMHILRLGFAVQRFTPYADCPSAFPKAQQVYLVDSGKFGGGNHTNSAEEWVAMLLHGKAFPPRLCT
jgi:hypothetical protein